MPPSCEELKVPTLYATWEDMNKPFEKFIEKHEKKIAAIGLARVVPPETWMPRASGYAEDYDMRIERCIKQVATGSRGMYRFLLVEQKPMSLKLNFRPEALADDNQPGTSEQAELERKYWRTILLRSPKYGADIHGSLFDEDCKGWSLRHLDTLLSRTLEESGHDLPGVSSPYLYFGMWRSTFAWHCEDLDLYSVNYLHFGATKHWYCIPPAHRQRFEVLMKSLLPDMFRACPEFLRHKELLISPQILDQHKIPYVRAVQNPREFMINYPGAYHAGFNAGYNCAESVNFGTKHWIPIGARAGICSCSSDSVKIDMRLFRHLVPAKLLPPELLEDTSDEEEEDEEKEDTESDELKESRNVKKRRTTSRAVRGGRMMGSTGSCRGASRTSERQSTPAGQCKGGRQCSGQAVPPTPRAQRQKRKGKAGTSVVDVYAVAAAAAAAAVPRLSHSWEIESDWPESPHSMPSTCSVATVCLGNSEAGGRSSRLAHSLHNSEVVEQVPTGLAPVMRSRRLQQRKDKEQQQQQWTMLLQEGDCQVGEVKVASLRRGRAVARPANSHAKVVGGSTLREATTRRSPSLKSQPARRIRPTWKLAERLDQQED